MKKRIIIGISLIIVCLLVFEFIPSAQTNEKNYFLKNGNKPLNIAHGGAKLLFPENTMLAFDGSYKIGIDVFELDTCITKDGVLITHHNLEISETTDGKGNIIDYTFNDLKKFNFGAKFKDLKGNMPYANKKVGVTALEELFKKYPDMRYIVEIKNDETDGERAVDALVSLIEKYNLGHRIIIASFHDDVISYIHKNYPTILTNAAQGETTKFVLSTYSFTSKLLVNTKATAIQLPISQYGIPLDTKLLIRSIHSRNLAVHYWTINDKETMKELIDLGVDGIITDRPDLLHELLENK